MSVGENSRKLVLGLVSTMAAGVLFSATAAEPVPVVDWAEPAGWHAVEPGKVVSDGAIVTVRQPGISSRTFPHYPLDDGRDLDRTYQGISFRVRGDGSDEWGCININNGSRFGGAFYFPVKNTDWMEYRVAFADMAPISDHACGLPRNVAAGDLGTLTFGDYWKIGTGNLPRPVFRYEVTDLKLLPEIPARFETEKKRPLPLAEAIKRMRQGRPTAIFCFGDSVTAGTSLKNREGERFATLLGPALAKYFKNPGITSRCVATGGAHTYQAIGWLERDLREGVPDIAVMLIGGNNYNAAQSPELFRQQLSIWLERLVQLTDGQCAVVLIPTLPGVPRFRVRDYLATATCDVARDYGCAICPFHETIKALGPFVYKEKYLADSVHPNAAGHALLLEELARLLTQR